MGTQTTGALLLEIQETLLKRIDEISNRLASVEAKVGGGSPPTLPATSAPAAPASSGASDAVAPSVQAYDEFLSTSLSPVVGFGKQIGGEVGEITDILEKAFKAEREVVVAISKCKKPAPEVFGKLAFITAVGEQIGAAHSKADGKRTDAFNHYKTVSETLNALTWVCYLGPNMGMSLPVPHVDESWQCGEFYANKILREFKDKDKNHVDWVKALKELYMGLKAYVKQHHATGPSWNMKGVDAASYSPSAAGGAKPSGPPPPGPPP
eukprot:CAMPEP_0197847824 /NCGR_PEP_ID=MMETSP1438-20131217/7207_1 /TAXON_ID=1461541 /ORGANISM="Pterosperma sp., Strain CCMP1384" /LENGTH=265 /DNA_ID=CAMNT_0043459861 /DNA_START=79 /DNA_END=872 /DNA_ORIENTATION=+